jgi:transposase
LHRIFNYVLQMLYMGCQWKALPIDKDCLGRPEIHHTRIYRAMRRWQAAGCMDAIFAGSVGKLHRDQLLDLTVVHGDGTTTAAKKGGDNLGYSGHKHLKGDKVVVFCDRDCNVIAPFVAAAGNRNESPLTRGADVNRHTELQSFNRSESASSELASHRSWGWLGADHPGCVDRPFSRAPGRSAVRD